MQFPHKLFSAFITIILGRVYERVPKEIMWWNLGKKEAFNRYVNLITDINDGVVTHMRTMAYLTEAFPVTVRLHQRSTLNRYLFALVTKNLLVI